MRGLNPGTDPDLATRVRERLDARMERHVDHPLALALSGGGDSMALLGLTADWARRNGRRLVAITVDHGLNPDSPRWNALCAETARAVGADWRLCEWLGDKPTTGLPAAARAARHALVGDAAREFGAKVVLFAHTADDVAENDWMRAHGSTLGGLREWAPSPAWPEGRGLMLLRPLLRERREELRHWLTGREADWIEDPANDDDRFARTRARRSLNPLPAGEGLSAREPQAIGLARKGEGLGGEPVGTVTPHPFGYTHRFALRASSPLPLGEGFNCKRSTEATTLAATLLCASGTATPPRRDRLDALLARFRSGGDFTATLAGARIIATGDTVIVGREPGRTPRPETALTPDTPAVWDGRYQITTPIPGYTIAPAAGHLNRLSDADRVVLRTVHPALRPTLPVLIRDDGSAPVLAWRAATVMALGPRRQSLALGETTQECHLHATIHGETPPTDLFSIQELHQGGPHPPPTNRETR